VATICRNGAFNLQMAFGFFNSFGQPRPQPTDKRNWKEFNYGTPDGYQFFLNSVRSRMQTTNILKTGFRSGMRSSPIRITISSGKAAICCHI
jgi:hypothetical protein